MDYFKDGLYFYGFYKVDDCNKVIIIGVIGIIEGLEYFWCWGCSVFGDVFVLFLKKMDKEYCFYFSNFLGMFVVFGVSFDFWDFIEYVVDGDKIEIIIVL